MLAYHIHTSFGSRRMRFNPIFGNFPRNGYIRCGRGGGGGRNEVMLSQLATRSIYDEVSGFWTMMQQAIFSRGMEAMAITTTMLWSHFRKFCYRRVVIRKQNLLLFSAEMQMIVPRFSTGPNGDC